MLVYRVEDIKGTGMYRGAGTATAAMHETAGAHPMPEQDDALMSQLTGAQRFRNYPSTMFNYGFGSIEQFKRWVYRDEWRKALDLAGYSLSVYECSEGAYVGDTQAVFMRKHAKLVDTKRLTEL